MSKAKETKKKEVILPQNFMKNDLKLYSSIGKMILSNKLTEPSFKIGLANRDQNNV